MGDALRLAARAFGCAGALLVAAAPGAGSAWNARGHRIVARIAEARLDGRSRQAARALLGGAHLADVATVADGEARRRPETGPWHWVNIGPEDGGYDRARHCPTGDCVVARIESFGRVLGDATAPAAARAEALAFLVHLVADVHQPLHAGRAEDRGGNMLALAAPTGSATNLHQLYDGLPDACGLPRKERAAARALDAAVSPGEARSWIRAAPGDWATESHLLSRHVYGELTARADGAVELRGDPRRRCAMARLQLAKAGVRLAALLGAALR